MTYIAPPNFLFSDIIGTSQSKQSLISKLNVLSADIAALGGGTPVAAQFAALGIGVAATDPLTISYSNTVLTTPGVRLENPAGGAGQSLLQFTFGNVVKAQLRSDAGGNFVFSTTGTQYFGYTDLGAAQAINFANGKLTLSAAGDLQHNGSNIGVFGTTATSKKTVTGSRGGNAALQSLLTALASYGLITDSSS